MNCKPGDLAVKVRANTGDRIPVGALVTCISLHEQWLIRGLYDDTLRVLENVWEVEYNGEISPAGSPLNPWCVLDSNLKPLRNPGEDAQDETLSWLPVPEKEGVTA